MAPVKSLLTALLVPLAATAAALPAEEGRGIMIVGGTEAATAEFPYIVSLSSGGSHFCGGVLLNANTVVTAGHCSTDTSASSVRVRAGTNTWASGGTQVGVSSITVHPSYSESSDGIPFNDVAVWKLSSNIAESSTIKYARLASQDSDVSAGTVTTVAGWGYMQEGVRVLSSTLKKVDVPAISRSECRSQYGTSSITDVMWCAGYDEGGKDACNGDSGGPIVDPSGTLIGVVSWGNGCARAGFAGVYTRIGSFNNWINSI